MKSKSLKKKSTVILIVLIGVLLFQISMMNLDGNYRTLLNEKREFANPKTSEYWVLPTTIHVDNNWTATQTTYDWCTGAGTVGNPYIIENVTINAQNSGSCIYIQNTNDYFIIQNCTLINSAPSPDSAIQLELLSNGKIIDNNITNNNGRAISLFVANNMLVEDNNIVNNGYGITLAYSNDNTITKNYIQDSNFYGIYLWDSDNNDILENEVNHNGYYAGGYHGVYISESGTSVDSVNNLIKNNNINNNRKSGIYINSCDNNTIFANFIENNLEYGIYLHDSDDINIIGNKINDNNLACIANQSSLNLREEWNACNGVIDPFNIDDADAGDFTWAQVSLFAWCTGAGTFSDPYMLKDLSVDAQSIGSCIHIENSNGKYFIISGCTVTNAQSIAGEAGIRLDWVQDATIILNTVIENYVGIYLSYSENVTILNNDVIDDLGQGIILYLSSNNFVLDNRQNGSAYYGLFINGGSNENIISGNTFKDNTGAPTHGDGIRILDSESNNITNNNLINNDKGIRIQDSSNYNRINHNRIHNNTIYGAFVIADSRISHDNQFDSNSFDNPSAQNAYDNGTNTLWHNGTIGNFWSDYSGVDANDDGIGDTPHSFPGTGSTLDMFPIWDDGDDILPIVTINLPLDNSRYNTTAPTYSITIIELNLDTYYYEITGPSGGAIQIISSLSGSIDQSIWNALPAGTYTLIVFANDTAGNIGLASITIIKESLPSTPTPEIPFGHYYLLFSVMGILVLVGLVKLKLKRIS